MGASLPDDESNWGIAHTFNSKKKIYIPQWNIFYLSFEQEPHMIRLCENHIEVIN